MQNYHLLPDGDRWIVTREGPRAPVFSYGSRRTAVEQITEFLSGREASLKIHKPDGTIDEERTFPALPAR